MKWMIFLSAALPALPGRYSCKSPTGLLPAFDSRHSTPMPVAKMPAHCFSMPKGDLFLDLYVVSGSNEAPAGSEVYLDRLYLNDGLGNFTRSPEALPSEAESGSVARAFDFDGDGDGKMVEWWSNRPVFRALCSLLLVNNGKGRFTAATPGLAGPLERAGMVTDAQWADLC